MDDDVDTDHVMQQIWEITAGEEDLRTDEEIFVAWEGGEVGNIETTIGECNSIRLQA